jgi:uncharacterized protein
MAFPPRLSLVTLGVANVDAAARFYERLGWKRSSGSQQAVVFFDLGGIVLSLFGRDDLAADAGMPLALPATASFVLAINLGSQSEVDSAIATAAGAGASLLKAASGTGWGGYAGYIADLDGHAWEIAYNPFWPLDADGHLEIPD